MKVLFFIFVGLDFFRWEGEGEVAGGNFFFCFMSVGLFWQGYKGADVGGG